MDREVVTQAASLPHRRLPVGKSRNAGPRFRGIMQFQWNWLLPTDRNADVLVRRQNARFKDMMQFKRNWTLPTIRLVFEPRRRLRPGERLRLSRSVRRSVLPLEPCRQDRTDGVIATVGVAEGDPGDTAREAQGEL
jgi:hypothetical protein